MTLAEFADAITRYCELGHASVTSWKRTSVRNTLVGGVRYSAHLVGLAADVVYDGDAAPEVRVEWGRRLGLQVIIEADHDHLQPLDWPKG